MSVDPSLDTGSATPVVAARPLRFALMVPGPVLAAWQREAIVKLVESGVASLELMIVDGRERLPATGTRRIVDMVRRDKAAWHLYNNVWVARRSQATRGVDCAALFEGVPTLTCRPERVGRFSEHFSDEDVAAVHGYDLDFILRFAFGIIRGPILDAARFGVWSFHHDDEGRYRGSPPSFWEVASGDPVTGVLFQRLTDRLDAGVVLKKGWFASVRHSYPRNRDRTLFGSADFPALVARAVHAGIADPVALPAATTGAPIYKNPSNREFARFLVGNARRLVRSQVEGVVRADKWGVGLAAADVTRPPFRLDTDKVHWLPELRRHGYLADPFLAVRDGRTAILLEDFDYRSNRGVISAIEIDPATLAMGAVHTGVIDPGVHTSYPFLIEVDGELFCVPETGQAAEVGVWRCVDFPARWERRATLLDGVALVDPTVSPRAGRWWLMGALRGPDVNTKLHLWHSESFFGPYVPHVANPVKVDVRSSRPAGSPFEVDGVLYRPAQDCSTAYGGALAINRIDRLTETEFAETTIRRIEPRGRYPAGIHTLNGIGGLAVFDGNRRSFEPAHTWREIRARLRLRAPLV